MSKKGLTITINAKFVLIVSLYLVLIAVLVFDIIDLYHLDQLAKAINSEISVAGIFEFIFRVLFEILIVATIHLVAYRKIELIAAPDTATVTPEPKLKSVNITNSYTPTLQTKPVNAASRYIPTPQNSVKVVLPNVHLFDDCEYVKTKEYYSVSLSGLSWAGNKENVENIIAGEELILEKRKPSIHGANSLAVLTVSGKTLGYIYNNRFREEIEAALTVKTAVLAYAENSPLQTICVGLYTLQSHPNKITTFSVKVVGVTFKNDDGKSRQHILSEINTRKLGGIVTGNEIEIIKYTFNGSPAIGVSIAGEMVGNFPADFVPFYYDYWENIIDTPKLKVYGGSDSKPFGAELTIRLRGVAKKQQGGI
jgi:hypothetical protein